MGLDTHLYRRGATYYWRRILPARQAAASNRSEIGGRSEKRTVRDLRLSLRTQVPGVARYRARRLGVVTDIVLGLLQDAMNAGLISTATLRTLVTEILVNELDRAEYERALGGERTPEEIAARVRTELAMAEQLKEHPALVPGGMIASRESCASRPEPDDRTEPGTSSMLDLPISKAVKVWIDDIQGTSAIRTILADAPEAAGIAAPASSDKAVCKEEQRDMNNAVRLFVDLIGDKTIRDITRDDARTFKNRLGRVPKMHGRGQYKEMSAVGAIRKADEIERVQIAAVKERIRLGEIDPDNAKLAIGEQAVPRLALKTINKHLDIIGRLFKWLRFDKDQQVDGDLLRGLRFTKLELGREASEEREAWSERELRDLFATPNWTGCAGPNHRHRPGPHIIKNAKYWIPLLEPHLGLRLGEAAQLLVEDVIPVTLDIADLKGWGIDIHDSKTPWPRLLRLSTALSKTGSNAGEITIWCIKVSPDDNGKKVKTETSKRLVPLHPLLLELGFLDFVEQQKRAGKLRVFPGLEQEHRSRHGGKISKWLTRYLKYVGMYQPGRGNQSMRHSFDTHLINRDDLEVRVSELLGHRRNGQTKGRYYKGANLAKLVEAIGKIDYRLNSRVVDGQLQLIKPSDIA